MDRIRIAWRSLGRGRQIAIVLLLALAALQVVLCIAVDALFLLPAVAMVGIIGLVLIKLSAVNRDATARLSRTLAAAHESAAASRAADARLQVVERAAARSHEMTRQRLVEAEGLQRDALRLLRLVHDDLGRTSSDLGELGRRAVTAQSSVNALTQAARDHGAALAAQSARAAGTEEFLARLGAESSASFEEQRALDRRLTKALDGGDSSSIERRLVSEMSAMLLLRGSGDRPTLPPFEGWSMSPLAVRFIQEVAERLDSRSTIVELGSGVSTAWTAFALSKLQDPPRFVAIDHDASYAAATQRHLDALGSPEQVDVVLAPLAPVTVDAVEYHWYGTDWIADVREIGLLIVDGPPAGRNTSARFPALPLLLDRLADQATILVDDANRPGESDMVKSWLATPGISRIGLVGRSLVLSFSRADSQRSS